MPRGYVPEMIVFLTSFLRVVHHYSAILEGHEPMAPVAATERAKRMAAECCCLSTRIRSVHEELCSTK